MNKYYLALIPLLLIMTGCASSPETAVETSPEAQMISVHTPGVMGANCFVQVDGMSYPVATPGHVMVRQSKSPMDVTCFKGEHMVGNQKIAPICNSCGYPAAVSVAMALDGNSLRKDYRIIP